MGVWRRAAVHPSVPRLPTNCWHVIGGGQGSPILSGTVPVPRIREVYGAQGTFRATGLKTPEYERLYGSNCERILDLVDQALAAKGSGTERRRPLDDATRTLLQAVVAQQLLQPTADAQQRLRLAADRTSLLTLITALRNVGDIIGRLGR